MDFAQCEPESLIDEWFGRTITTPSNFKATNGWFVFILDFVHATLSPLLKFKEIKDFNNVIRTHLVYFSQSGNPRLYAITAHDNSTTRRQLVFQLLSDFGYFTRSPRAKIYNLVRICAAPDCCISDLLAFFDITLGIQIGRLCIADVETIRLQARLLGEESQEEFNKLFRRETTDHPTPSH